MALLCFLLSRKSGISECLMIRTAAYLSWIVPTLRGPFPFLDSGEKVFSGTMYEHPREAKGMLLHAEGAQVDVESWEMKESVE